MSRKSCIFFSIGIAGGFFGQIKVERRGVIQVQIKVKPSGLKFEGLRYTGNIDTVFAVCFQIQKNPEKRSIFLRFRKSWRVFFPGSEFLGATEE